MRCDCGNFRGVRASGAGRRELVFATVAAMEFGTAAGLHPAACPDFLADLEDFSPGGRGNDSYRRRTFMASDNNGSQRAPATSR